MTTIDLIPPQSLDMEQAVLGAALIDARVIDEAAAILRPEDFYRDAHRVIWECLLNLTERHDPIDLYTLQEELKRMEVLENVGGTPYLVALTDAVPTTANAGYYAKIVEEKAVCRRLLDASNRITALVHSEREEGEDVSQLAESIIYETVRSRTVGAGMLDMRPAVAKWFEWVESRADSDCPLYGIRTGLRCFDSLTNGLKPADLAIIGARPGQGKTGLLMNAAIHAAKHHGAVAVFSLEMTSQQLMGRMVSSMARVDSKRMESGGMEEHQWRQIGAACAELSDLPIHICESASITPAEMRSKIRRLRSQTPVALVVVDYLQLVQPTRRTENRTQEVGEISRALKGIAREFNLPVLAAAQINRESEKRAGNRPQLSDLRESGSIEAEADIVALIHRPRYYEARKNAEELRGMEVAELIVDKHRNGQTGVLRVAFTPEYCTFNDLYEERHA